MQRIGYTVKLGEQLTNLFYRPYTKKMWGLDLKEISYSIVKRIKFSFSKEKRYFPNDTIQCLPQKVIQVCLKIYMIMKI